MTLNSPYSVLFCEVETLLAQCTECVAGKEPRSSLWKTIDKECDVGFSTEFSYDYFIANKCPTFSASLGGYLVAMKCTPRFYDMIWAHSPYIKSWICVGKICTLLGYNTVLVSRGSELVLFGVDTNKVLKMTLHGKVPRSGVYRFTAFSS